MATFKLTWPQVDTNLFKNPSFERTTSKLAAGTNWTISQSAEQQYKGVYSLKCVSSASAATTIADLSLDTLATSTTYIVSGWVYVSSGWDGGNVRLIGTGYTGSTETYNNIYTDGTDAVDAWVYMETKIVIDADAVGDIALETTSAPTASKSLYIDCVNVVASASSVSYIDGDQPGCIWLGEPHETISKRGITRMGGLVKDLRDDLSFRIQQIIGLGMYPVENLSDTLGQLDGAVPDETIVMPREFTMVGTVSGSSLDNMQSIRRDLVKSFSQKQTQRTEPIRLEYHGDTKVLEIDVRYVDGLGGQPKNGYLETFGLTLRADDPYWREQGQEGTSLTLTTSLSSVNYIVLRDPAGDYSAIASTLDGAVFSTTFNPTTNLLYIGGTFTNAGGGGEGDGFATYNIDTATWATLGASQLAGGSAECNTIEVAANGDIYIGGSFTTAGGTTCNNVTYWNGSAWTALTSGGDIGVNGRVYDLTFDDDGNLYIIGGFTATGGAGGLTERGVIKWDGTNFTALSGGTAIVDGNCRAAIIDDAGSLVVGGTFTTGGGSGGNYIIKYTLAATSPAWTAYDSEPNNNVLAIGKATAGGFVIAGAFTTIGGDTRNYVSYYNSAAWFSMDSGVNQTVNALSTLPDGRVYIGGSFTATGGGRTLNRANAYWNGAAWYSLDIVLPGSSSVNTASLRNDGYLVLGFDTSGTATVGYSDVTNNGTAYAYPKVVITGAAGDSPIQSLSLVQSNSFSDSVVVTPRVIYFDNLTLLEGEVFTMDFRPNKWSFISSTRGDMISKILNGSNITGFFLTPGANVARLYTDNSSTTMVMYWDVRHESLDGVAT
jgi:hypothetical protein